MSWFAAQQWLRGYAPAVFRADAVAGLSLAAFAIPESIAYATLAGLPPAAGLYCYLAAGVAYAPFGSSRRIAVGPTSAIALLLASSLAPLAGGDAGRYALLAGSVAVLVGLICLAARLVRASFVVNFISDVVLTGFKTGAALFIASTQAPKIFGIDTSGDNFFTRTWSLLAQLDRTHGPSLALGGAVLVALLVLGRRFPGRPTTIAVVAVVLAAMQSGALDATGIRIAGPLPNGLPRPVLPFEGLAAHDLGAAGAVALACFLLAYVESISTARALAGERGPAVDADAELVGLGAANLAAGLLRGFPVSGGMSQSAVNDLAGARTPAALVVTSASVGVVLLLFAGVFSRTPEPLLGAIVVVAAVHLVHVAALRKLWRSSRREFWVAIFAAVAVLATGLLEGVLIAAIFSLLMLLSRATQPEIAVLGELPGTTVYVNTAFNPDAVRPDGVLVLRTYGAWRYFNADYIRRRLLELVDAAEPQPRLVVLDFSASPSLDVQSIAVLGAIGTELHARGIRLAFAHLYDETAATMARAGGVAEPLDAHRRIHDLVERYQYVARVFGDRPQDAPA